MRVRNGRDRSARGESSARAGAARSAGAAGAAGRLAPLADRLLGGPLPVRLRAWDGSEFGPSDAPVVELRSRRALRRLLWRPGELGLAQAYIAGDVGVPGDLAYGLRTVWRAARERELRPPRMSAPERARAAAVLLRLGAVGPPPPAPGRRARLRGRLHSTARDRAAVGHHYDLSNDFYALLLDETMAYSCGYWAREEGETAYAGAADEGAYGPADAQRDKLELICRKLALAPGTTLLDIGCGWGSLSLYAAECLGVRVTAVTLSAEQAAYVREQVRRRSLEGLVEVRLAHYRDLGHGDGAHGGHGAGRAHGPDGRPYDAVAAVEMGEHVGDEEYPHFAATLHRMVRPRGRALVQQMSRGYVAPGGGAFIESYIAPDMHMRPLGDTLSLLEATGLEVRSCESLREHYALTIAAWARTLERRWPAVTDLVGEETARVWRLYLTGGGLAFEERRMGVDQILAVRTTADGDSGVRERPGEWYEGLGEPRAPLTSHAPVALRTAPEDSEESRENGPEDGR